MQNRIFIIIPAILVAVGIGLYCYYKNIDPGKLPIVESQRQIDEKSSIHVQSHQGGDCIDYYIPADTPQSAILDMFSKETYEQFKQTSPPVNIIPKCNQTEDGYQEYIVTKYSAYSITSYIVNSKEFSKGAAYPNSEAQSFNYKKDDKRVNLKNIIKTGKEQAFWSVVFATIQKCSDSEKCALSLSPADLENYDPEDVKNYNNFFLTSDNLVILLNTSIFGERGHTFSMAFEIPVENIREYLNF